MIKEIALAIALGALLGFGITGGYIATKKNRSTTPPPIVNSETITPEPDKTDNLSPTKSPEPVESNISSDDSVLSINNPQNESIVSNSLLNLKGNTFSKGIIIINTGVKHYQTTASDNGDFQVDIELDSGINNIQIDTFDKEGNQITKTIQVTYSTAKI
jgi:hypothetical protein